MPVATAPSLPNLAAPPVGRLDINAPAATENEAAATPDVAPTTPPTSTEGASAAAAAAAAASPAVGNGDSGVAVAREERERQVKLGLLVVRLGGAKEKNVFGARGLTVPPRDLLVIHRPEDDAVARRPFKWYDPISWFLSGPRQSPMIWSSAPAGATSSRASPTTPPATVTAATSAASAIGDASVAAAVAASTAMAAASASARKKRPLPHIDMQPLKDAETLEPAVSEERAKLLKDEAAVHSVLDKIEEARYTYLVPSQELRCEAEVMSVLRCYMDSSAVAGSRAASAEASSPTALPAVAGVLQCGPVVGLLKQCVEGVVASYSESDGGRP
ncbi:hypothetical protein TraAM80_06316 [Trypanosoma rangeli]|uniref:Uncharacterized protein n=1 Tax=Trypanosoma rangeli TaxID=5698 RepID=A0A422NAY0_TRYRA|nr:uncharacterized protein TraAM80_06316 [Trypanosoma rangeli]RNF02634.1 hypothetical protein TraAM80_06316 [Trypanosoma rangeli]|eukprot:RNF02634.1 hypothetical protein TraAM80_06316 [Trypanosoma rangeli]